MSTSKPTIVLVHGAWHTPPNYSRFISALQSRGFTVHCPHLPSCSNTRPPTATYTDDVAVVRTLVQDLSQKGDRILMIMHSYGGAIGTDAIQDLDVPSRATAGLPGGVTHLLYLCAYMQPPGRSVFDVVEEANMTPLWSQFIEDGDDRTCFPVDPVLSFFGDVDTEKIQEGLPHLVRSPLGAFEVKSVGDGWKKLPVTYVTATKDYSVPRVYQDLMLKRVAAEGVEVKVVDVDAAHSVFLSREAEMVELVEEVVSDGRNP
ncbi:alpha/beta-hydrolase [Aspergillus ellipticus CBS 707.79]|uniref:Alpha/beta-hydrolase n=1 Tax=Aspergillus ellipticus CBS 707.79 TaxID=1448320 RepID=A0A319DLB1_9EURO|nr:alpha/beta-hydrolase [Aspergillus ellipticus CBS 707.79]